MAVYIHQRKEWPRFTWDNEEVLPKLGETRYLQGMLLGKIENLGFKMQSEAALDNMTLDVIKSSEIEGEILMEDQVRSSIARHLGIDAGGLVPSDRNVDGIVEMVLDATQNYKDKISEERLHLWHGLLFPFGKSGGFEITAGGWRTPEKGPMQVVSGASGREIVHFEAPASEQVGEEMNVFISWLNTSTEEPVLKAAIAHLWFLTIHPFDDGNGRIARALTELLLSRADKKAQRFYSMSAEIRKSRGAYYKILEETQKGDLDITEWLTWFLDCLCRALINTEEVITHILNKSRFWSKIAGHDINSRQKIMINRLLDGFSGKLNTSKWAKIAKCSQDTALRDIQDLLNKGILIKEEAGGRSTSYSLISMS